MKAISPKQVAIYIAALPSVLFVLVFTATTSLSGGYLLIAILGLMALLFVTVYFLASYFIDNFIFEKIKPIYRTIHDTRISGKELKK